MRGFLQAFVIMGLAALFVEAQDPAPKSEPPARTEPSVTLERDGPNRREAPAATAPAAGETRKKASPQHPLISFIDSPTATCYQPDPRRDVCFINWYYFSVDASPNYMTGLWVFLNPNLVSQTQGFFQTSIYVPYSMLGQGFRVACGPPVDDTTTLPGVTITHGNQYAYTIRARDSASLSSANYGSVTCPAFLPAP